jgi:phage gpG-like protein
MLTVELVGKEQLLAKLDALPQTIKGELRKETQSLAIQLQAHIINQKLHGQVLKQRSGKLARSIQEEVSETPTGVQGRVYSAGDVKYAAIHEFGFSGPETVSAHVRTVVFGKTVEPFTVPSFVRQINMPERSFMRSSLAEFKDRITQGYAQAVKRGAAL